jgi:hypothetical protein
LLQVITILPGELKSIAYLIELQRCDLFCQYKSLPLYQKKLFRP